MVIRRIEGSDPFIYPDMNLGEPAPVQPKKNNEYYKDSIKPVGVHYSNLAFINAWITQTELAGELGKLNAEEILTLAKTNKVLWKEKTKIENENINLNKVGKVVSTVQTVANVALIAAGIVGFFITCFLGFAAIPLALIVVSGVAGLVKAGTMVTNGVIDHKVNLGKAAILPNTEKHRQNNDKSKHLSTEMGRGDKKINDAFAQMAEIESKKQEVIKALRS